MVASKPEEWRRPEHARLLRGEPRRDLGEQAHGVALVRAGRDDSNEVAEWRIAELPAPLELLGEESGDVVPGRMHDRPRVRLKRLDDDPARRIATASSCELRHELERPFFGPEIRHGEPGVRIDDRREGDAGEVVALRDHLGPDQDRPICLGEPAESGGELAGPANGVGVEPDPLEPRNLLRQLLLELLGARADAGELG